jgi:hypothetical protein
MQSWWLRPMIARMDDCGFHRIEDDLADRWIEEWAGAGVAELERYLDKHAAFVRFLDAREAPGLPAD